VAIGILRLRREEGAPAPLLGSRIELQEISPCRSIDGGKYPMRFALLLGLLLSLPVAAVATTCAGPNRPCEALNQANLVFVGRVISTTEARTADERPSARLRVTEVFRGHPPRTIEVGFSTLALVRGTTYLVFANRDESGNVFMYPCSGTVELAGAAEDLRYLRRMNSESPLSSISGNVKEWRPGASDKPIAGVVIVASGTRSYRGRTNAKGEFRMGGIAPGEYTLETILPDSVYLAEQPRKISLSAHGCSEEDYSVVNNGTISGQVLLPPGTAPKELNVEIVARDPKPNVTVDRAMTPAQDGSFEFRGLPVGKYIIGVGINQPPSVRQPFSRFIYSGPTGSGPKILKIRGPDHIAGINFPAPPRATPIDVAVHLTMPDDTSAPRADVSASDQGYPYVVSPADKDGNWVAHLYQGETFELHATDPHPVPANKPWEASLCAGESVHVDTAGQKVELHLTADRCRIERNAREQNWLSHGREGMPVDFELTWDDGKPIAYGMVVLVSSKSAGNSFETDAEGHVRISVPKNDHYLVSPWSPQARKCDTPGQRALSTHGEAPTWSAQQVDQKKAEWWRELPEKGTVELRILRVPWGCASAK
jgi:hypothetical protein